MQKQQAGFTLIELMITVVVMSIIMAVAVPSYRDYTQRTNRADATMTLLRIAAAQERFYLQNGIYASNAQLVLAPPAGLGITNRLSERGYYSFSILDSAGNLAIGYTIRAVPVTGERQDDDFCTEFSVDQNGRRGALEGYDAANVEKCWR
ncbi:MAG: type IV pilin protein [Gammaproteobacteria bacterium]